MGACSPRKIFKFRPYEVLLRPSETTITTHKIYGNWTVTQAIHRMVVSQSPSLRNQPLYMRHFQMVAGVDPRGAWGALAPPFGTEQALNAEVLRYCFAVQQANENCVRKLQISDDTINSRTLLIQKVESSVKQGWIQRLKKGGHT